MSRLKNYSIRILVISIIHIYLKMYDSTFFGIVGNVGFRDAFYYVFSLLFGFVAWEITERVNKKIISTYHAKELSRKIVIFGFVHLIMGIMWGAVFSTIYYYSTLSLFGIKIFEDFYITDADLSFGILIFYIIVNSIAGIKLFYTQWKNELVKNERLEKEFALSKYEALKNQIDPHFFFNSLSVLSNLVYKNQDLAADFINKLSKLYRYILDIRERRLVTIQEELLFVQNYFYLMKIRHGDQIILNISDVENESVFLPPITLQLLVENAIKHNIYSEEEPLLIKISKQDDYIIVQNSVQKRKLLSEGSGLGLANIVSRYKLITEQGVIIKEDEKEFKVLLPIIRSNEYENSNI